MGESIDALQAAALGLLQGLTEFLPVSSSGHVAIGAELLGLRDQPLAFVVLLHAGTLLATLALFWSDIAEIVKDLGAHLMQPSQLLQTKSGQLAAAIVAATVVTVAVALTLEPFVEQYSSSMSLVGICLLGSAVAVLLTKRVSGHSELPTLKHALVIGLVQGLAVLPGLSRSGSTIAAAMLLGVSGAAAFRFSFLLSLPIVAGAALRALGSEPLSHIGSAALIGGTVAMVSGYLSLLVLRRVLLLGQLWVFAFYLVPLGIGLLIWGVTS